MQRALRGTGFFLFSFMLLFVTASPDAWARPNPKYAGLVIDAETREVLYADNATKLRYPASLTKMMTLYMAFEALSKKKLYLNQMVPVSKHAASMPQTNISLKKGDRISVEDLIISMIVRSANDSAVVMAEKLGKTEWNFARMMTEKARELGMTRTSFRNASGLPHRKQRTTAKDMATLALALYEDFPQYYHYFKKTRFKYKGRTYTSHNKVVRYYKGADGLKTGYIRASGFNVAISASRNGQRLVAVVMGGRKARSRDRHMIDLLDRSFRKIRNRKSFATVFKGNYPTPQAKPISLPTSIAIASTGRVKALPASPRPESKPVQVASAGDEIFVPAPEFKPLSAELAVPLPQPKPGTSPFAPEEQKIASLPSSMEGWGIQVGVFHMEREALIAAANAINLAAQELSTSSIRIQSLGELHEGVHRARLSGLTENQARHACKKLRLLNEACFVYREKSKNQHL